MLTEVSLPSENCLRQIVKETLDQVLVFAEQQAAASIQNRNMTVRVQDIPTIFASLKPESCWKD